MMKCPVDGATLQMSERSGIEIDYCPDCRGVWLDRGELDKIIAKTAEAEAPPPAPVAAPPQTPPQPQQQGGPWAQSGYPPQQPYGHGYDPRHGHKPHNRKKSFLEDLFD